MPSWISLALQPAPQLIWMFAGIGVPCALLLLPRRDWGRPALVACLALAAGPAVVTLWLFVLGALGGRTQTPLMSAEGLNAGLWALTLAGILLALVKWRRTPHVVRAPEPRFAFDERLLLALMAAAIGVRWLATAYWPATAYDELWVYGYQGRLYHALRYIPETIGYYPQFLSLQFTYLGILVAPNPHVVRAVLPFLHLGSILAAYVLGRLLLNRRAGVVLAALWALYPHVGAWARHGDLEIPQTFLFTAAAAFFLHSWQHPARLRSAMLAGLLLGVALWTKPTAGAFVWAVLLLVAVDLARRAWRERPRLTQMARWVWAQPRFRAAFVTGLCCLPMGGMWYARNALLGLPVLEFPETYWLTQAARSGAEFGFPLLALVVLLAYLYVGEHPVRPSWKLVLPGALLVAAGVLPGIVIPLEVEAGRLPPSLLPARMGALEWAALLAGSALLALALRRHARHASDAARAEAVTVGWGLLFAAPYFVTWFYSYSYHYRLSFAIVPLMALPTAALLARWLPSARVRAWRAPVRWLYAALLVALALPGVTAALYDRNAGWDWLWTDKLPEDDVVKFNTGNSALQNVVSQMWIFRSSTGRDARVAAPGVQRLPYFFPLGDVRIMDAPTRLSQLDDADLFVYSYEGERMYRNVPRLQNQVLASLRRSEVMTLLVGHYDGDFLYEVYRLTPGSRFATPDMTHPLRAAAQFGGFARLAGFSLADTTLVPGTPFPLTLYWQALAPAPDDYVVYVHLLDADGVLRATGDGVIARRGDYYYSTLLWEAGEYVHDARAVALPADLPPGDYRIVVGFYGLSGGARVPVTLDGRGAGDGYTLDVTLSVRP